MKLNVNSQKFFALEDKRAALARDNNLKELEETYIDNSPELINLNTKSFWNKNISSELFSLKNSAIYNKKNAIVSKYVLKTRGKILDIGFGYGDLERAFQEDKNVSIFGIDISNHAVTQAKKNMRGSYSTGNILDLNFGGSMFDVVVALDVLEHIPSNKTFLALSEVRRVLKKRGTFIVSVPLNEGLKEMIMSGINPNGHLRVYTPDLIKSELKIAGYKIINDVKLFAFKDNFEIKNFVLKIAPIIKRQPNLDIIFAMK